MNDGWLCIFKDNSRMKVTEGYNPNVVSTNLPKWPHYFHEEEEHEKDREYYRVGDAVIIYNEQMEETKTLDLPYSLLDTYCHVAEPVRHLKDFTQNCIMTLDDSQNFFTTFIQGLFTHKLLRNRRGFINDKPPTEKSQFIDIGVNICTTNENTKNCQKIQNDTAIPNEGCWKLDIYIHHNFTNLTAIDVFLTCSSENDFDEQDIVSFNVKFLQKNETLSTATRVSGKFGYKVGLPIITGKYVPVVESAEDNGKVFIINYFHNNATIREAFKSISLPKSVSGACTNRSSDAVNFHENSLTQCSIAISNSSGLTADTNYTNVCDALQRTVFHYLINDENFAGKFELHVSELGWPLNVSSNWIQIEAKNFENRQVMGSYNADTNSFRCQNMLLSVRYEFTTARVTLNGVQHQNVVKKVAAEFGNRVDLHFKLEEDLTLPVYMYVMFHDATSSDSPRQCPFPIQLNIFLVTFVVAFYSKYSMYNA
ncbi:unnamed protein product [Hermetia illucens]|uniref:Tectonic-1-3 domain-containing protein n=2 Tax=Hermetia illucens TaxID=343691 RepID=A0A7R8UMI6_HERIL|nr:unnamed protein product [Hermetia illucens]